MFIADSINPNGKVQATGSISLSAQNDIVEGSSYTSGTPSSLGSNGIPLKPGSASTANACNNLSLVLCAYTQNGDVQLDANNYVTGTVQIFGDRFGDPGNIGNISFTNTNGIALAMGESPQSGVATMAKFNNGTTPYTLVLTSLDGNINIGSLPGEDDGLASLVAVNALTLRAGGAITQDPSGFISMPSGTQFTATASGNISLSSTTNAISSVITLQSPGTINLVNSVDTTVGSIGDGPDLGGRPQAATSVSIQIMGEDNQLLQDTSAATSLGITAGTISLSTQGGGIGTNGASILLSGGLDSDGIADAATTSFSAATNGGTAYLAALSPLSIANSGISLGGGAMVLIGQNNITVNAPITTTANVIGIDTGGSIQVNAPITAAFDGSTPGVIGLIANDPYYGANSASSAISGSGLLTAGYIDLTAGPGQNGQSGSIGQGTPTQSTAPLQVTSDTGQPLSLAIRTYGGNAYINSAVGVSIDDQTALLENYDVGEPPGGLAAGINTQSGGSIVCGSGACYGEVFLTAAGPISQTYGIQSGILTLTATGSNGTIALTDTGSMNDPGNSVFGQVHLNSTGNAAYSSGYANNMGANLGASTVGGSLVVISSNGDLDVQDPNGGAVQVTGTTTLSASGTGLGISIQSPVISGSSLSLIADQNISQGSSGGAELQTGSVLYVQSTSSSISLTDPANQVGAIALFSAAGDVVFQASSSLTLGNVTASNGGKIKIGSGGNLTIESGSVLTSSEGSGYSIQLSAAGNFINEMGAGALSMPSGAYFAIFSAAPGGDEFNGLNSGNTAIWDTTYASVAGTNAPNLGDRYVFAVQPTLTLSASNASKVYGVNDSAGLQTGYTVVSGLQPGVSGAYLADTLSSVFSTTPQAVSAGSAAAANVGTYAITISNISLANTYVPGDGYAVVVQNGTLTITPATLTYVANAASRSAGDLSPAFSGTVTGFVNSDTQASSTTGTLSFTSTATPASAAGSYAINGSGLTATDYVFVQAAGNASALTITGSSQSQVNGSTPVLTGFIAGLQPPLLNPANTPLGALPFNLIALPVVPPPTDITALSSFGNSSLWQ